VLRDDINKWSKKLLRACVSLSFRFDEGVKTGAKWMITLFDELDQRERAVYAFTESEARTCERWQ